MILSKAVDSCSFCGGARLEKSFSYTSPPEGEVAFPMGPDAVYYREYWRCAGCGHFSAGYDLDCSALYGKEYAAATYTDRQGMRKRFDRIVSLPPQESDNAARSLRVHGFASQLFNGRMTPPPASTPKGALRPQAGGGMKNPTLLDVGSGLGVFPYAMKRLGWECTALDPDDAAVEHLRQVAGVKAVKGMFREGLDLGRFDAITFNKVLEHVADPVRVLRASKGHLAPGGFVYVELPDGEMAALEGQGREEFFIEHLHVFSFSSITLLARQAGLSPVLVERLKEPSTKYTLRAFLLERTHERL